MVHAGHLLESIVFESLSIFVFLFTIVDIYFASRPENRPKVKSLQKVLYGCSLLSCLFAMAFTFDGRGAWRILTAVPDVIRLLCELMPAALIGIHVTNWKLSVAFSLCQAKVIVAPLRLFESIRDLRLMVALLSVMWIVSSSLTAILLSIYKRLVFTSILSGWICIQSSMSAYIASKISWYSYEEIKRLEQESRTSNTSIPSPSKSSNVQETMLITRKKALLKFVYSAFLGVVVALVTLSTFVYYLTLSGRRTSTEDLLRADPDDYEFFVLPWILVVTIAIVFTGGLVQYGFSFKALFSGDQAE
jgi:hypothetical protein